VVPSYRNGLLILLATVLLSAAASVATVRPHPDLPPAGEDLGRQPLTLGPFRLTERSGRDVLETDLADQVWVADFIFTRCPSSCPRITAVMKGLQARFGGTGVRLVSLSVDPEHDRPDVLDTFAQRFSADPARWWFLTGPVPIVDQLIRERFRLGVVVASPEEQAAGAESITHSTRLALVDRGNRVVGYYDADDPAAVSRLVKRARGLDLGWVLRLPELNATLNTSCSILLVVGLALIRSGRVRGHVVCMATTVALSALFLASYLTYHRQMGSTPFQGTGPIRIVYFTILLSHTVLAAAVLPLVILTLTRALRRRFVDHARLARLTFPIWLYVTITGVIVYLMLYRMDLSPSFG
jgi:protein SCO1/2